MIDTIYCLKKALHEKLSFLLDIAVKRTIQIIAKMIELINAIVTTVLMKKEPKDLQIMCPFQSLKYGLAVTNHCCEEIKIRVMSRSKCRNIP